MSRVVVASLVTPVLVLGAAVLPGRLSLPSRAEGRIEPVTSRALLVSGRDDHGLVATHEVPLAATAEGTGPAGLLHDGSVVELLSVQGRAHLVRSGSTSGWLDDEQLRSRVHLVGALPSCEPVVAGRRLPAGEQADLLAVVAGGVRIRLVRQPEVVAVVPLSTVSEVAPRPSATRCLPREDRGHDHG